MIQLLADSKVRKLAAQAVLVGDEDGGWPIPAEVYAAFPAEILGLLLDGIAEPVTAASGFEDCSMRKRLYFQRLYY